MKLPFHKKSIPFDIRKAENFFIPQPVSTGGPGQKRHDIYPLKCKRRPFVTDCIKAPLAEMFELANALVRPKQKNRKDAWLYQVLPLDDRVLVMDYLFSLDGELNENGGDDVITIYAELISGRPYLHIEFLEGYEPDPMYIPEITETIEMFIKLFKKELGVNVGNKTAKVARNIESVETFEATNRGKKLPENVVRSFIQPFTHDRSNKKRFPGAALLKHIRGGTRRKRRV